jgi:hypothetical protein
MTAPARAALDAAMRPGAWKRAGLAGSIVGLDYPAAMALAPRAADHDDFAFFLACAEDGLMQALDEMDTKPDGE